MCHKIATEAEIVESVRKMGEWMGAVSLVSGLVALFPPATIVAGLVSVFTGVIATAADCRTGQISCANITFLPFEIVSFRVKGLRGFFLDATLLGGTTALDEVG